MEPRKQLYLSDKKMNPVMVSQSELLQCIHCNSKRASYLFDILPFTHYDSTQMYVGGCVHLDKIIMKNYSFEIIAELCLKNKRRLCEFEVEPV